MIKSSEIIPVCNKYIEQYHIDNILEPILPNNILSGSLETLIKNKIQVDTTQWHLEDEVRNPNITAATGWAIKKKIDLLNQLRTDLVEEIDARMFDYFSEIKPHENSTINSETPGWIIDRLCILCLKIYHMNEQTLRTDVKVSHINQCLDKLNILKEQQTDLSNAFDELIMDLKSGKKHMKRYLQMKMYNDDQLNPVLYQK